MGVKVLNTETFIIKLKKIYGLKIDYSKIEYKNMATPVKLICQKHGLFMSRPHRLLKGKGCQKCSSEKRLTNQKMGIYKFQKLASKKHNNKYDYTLANYVNSKTKLKIICPEHGVFEQVPASHLSGIGCPKCGIKKRQLKQRMGINEFIKRSNIIHNNKYDYTLANYVNSKTKLKIICPEHGVFVQEVSSHLAGHGCCLCSNKKNAQYMTMSKEFFIKKAKKIHGDRYSYEEGLYKNSHSEMNIRCKIHGKFTQTPMTHLNGSGCPSCAHYGFNPDKPAILYYLKDTVTGLYKIGISNRTLDKRFGKSFMDPENNSYRIMPLMEQSFENGQDAYLAEQEILETFSDVRILNKSWPETKGGQTEFFTEDVLKLDKIR